MAEALHGPVQSALLSATLRLAQSRPAQDVQRTLCEVRTTVHAAIERFAEGVQTRPDLDAALQLTRRTWSPVCRITSAVSAAAAERLDVDPSAGRAVTAVITEACSNAVRHAHAQAIAIEIDLPADGELRAVITDVSQPHTTAGAPGGGTALLNAVTLRWQRVEREDGSTVTAVLPVLPAAGAH